MIKSRVSYISKVAIFSALSAVLYAWVKFPLSFMFPSFLEMNFCNIPVYISGFALGPVGGASVVIFRTLLKLLFVGTGTSYVGELSDMIIGLFVVLSSSIFYRFHKTRKGGIIAILIGTGVWVGGALIANWLVIVPAYIKLFFNGDVSIFLNLLKIIPNITVDNYMWKYLLYACLPFNALLSIVVGLVTFLIYKKISQLLQKF